MKYNLNTGRKYNLEKLGIKAETLKIYTVDADTKSPIMYALANGELAIINKGGAIRLELKDAMTICKELPQIIEEYKVFVRDGRRI